MPCLSSKSLLSWAVLALVGCSRENPIFGLHGTGEGSGSTGVSTTDGIESTVGSHSSTLGMTGPDPDSGPESSGVASDSSGSTGTPECGNGRKEAPEQCDDGENNGETQFCLPDCTKNVCGDGFTAPDQSCDDQNDEPDDGCDGCKLTSCGNGTIDGGEACDDGPQGSNMCTPQCTLPYCGDMITTTPEECDDANDVEEDACHDCIIASCGDGITWADMEECDDHNTESSDGCSSDCVVEFCGDGVVQEDEECDGEPADPLECLDGAMQAVVLACDSCEWFAEGGECCMESGDPCTNQIPCCPGTSCTDMGLCGG